MNHDRIVVDTNTFVAAGFNPNSHSARVFEEIRNGRLCLVWNEATRRETQTVVRKIPRISWDDYAGLFEEANRFDGETNEAAFGHVEDPADRKFAALAQAADAALITQDDHLLSTRDQADVYIARPREFFARWDAENEG